MRSNKTRYQHFIIGLDHNEVASSFNIQFNSNDAKYIQRELSDVKKQLDKYKIKLYSFFHFLFKLHGYTVPDEKKLIQSFQDKLYYQFIEHLENSKQFSKTENIEISQRPIQFARKRIIKKANFSQLNMILNLICITYPNEFTNHVENFITNNKTKKLNENLFMQDFNKLIKQLEFQKNHGNQIDDENKLIMKSNETRNNSHNNNTLIFNTKELEKNEYYNNTEDIEVSNEYESMDENHINIFH